MDSLGLFVASGLQNGALLASSAEILYVITITFVYQVTEGPRAYG